MTQTFTLQFSQDGTMYYVREMAFKHAWLGVQKHEEIPDKPRLVMPYSGVCAFERSGARYFRIFFNQSYIPVRAGESEERGPSDDLVRDYADAAAFVPLEDVAPPEPSATTPRKKRGSK